MAAGRNNKQMVTKQQHGFITVPHNTNTVVEISVKAYLKRPESLRSYIEQNSTFRHL